MSLRVRIQFCFTCADCGTTRWETADYRGFPLLPADWEPAIPGTIEQALCPVCQGRFDNKQEDETK